AEVERGVPELQHGQDGVAVAVQQRAGEGYSLGRRRVVHVPPFGCAGYGPAWLTGGASHGVNVESTTLSASEGREKRPVFPYPGTGPNLGRVPGVRCIRRRGKRPPWGGAGPSIEICSVSRLGRRATLVLVLSFPL